MRSAVEADLERALEDYLERQERTVSLRAM
jgi:hypothetical protein